MRISRSSLVILGMALVTLCVGCRSDSKLHYNPGRVYNMDKLSDEQVQLEIDRLLMMRATAYQRLHAKPVRIGYDTHNNNRDEPRQSVEVRKRKTNDYYRDLICEIDSQLERYWKENERRVRAKEDDGAADGE